MTDGRVWVRSRSRFVHVRGATSGEEAVSFTIADTFGPVSIELKRGPTPENHVLELLLAATTERTVNEARRAALEALADRRVPEGVTAIEGSGAFNDVGTPVATIIPETVKIFFRETFSLLGAVSRKTALALRWRHGLDVPLGGLEHIVGEFSLDGDRWVPAPQELTLRIGTVAIGIPLNERMAVQLSEVVADDKPVPAAHELLFEAQELAWTHQRSSLVISLAALEVGIKEVVATLVPGSAWLLDNLPAPPVERIIREYLPGLRVLTNLPDASAVTPTDELAKELKKAVRLRNELVHTGRDRIDPKWLDEWLGLCESLLYAFECFGGRAWAGERVNPAHRRLIATLVSSALAVPAALIGPGARQVPGVPRRLRRSRTGVPSDDPGRPSPHIR